MAVVRAGFGALRMNTLSFDPEGADRTGSATRIRFTYSATDYLQFDGQFSYDEFGRPGGVLNDITSVERGRTQFTLTGAAADARAFFGASDEQAAAAIVLAGDDRIYGRGKADSLIGFDGNDRLYGGNGDDTLTGGLGADRLYGEGGADRFVFDSTAESGTRPATRDSVLGFSTADGDRIDLSKIDAIEGGKGHTFTVVTDGFSNTAGELLIQESGKGYLASGDTNGDGRADFTIYVTTTDGPLTGDAFVL